MPGKKEKVIEREQRTWTKLKKGFSCSQVCVYIGHRWRRRKKKNKDPKILSTDHGQIF